MANTILKNLSNNKVPDKQLYQNWSYMDGLKFDGVNDVISTNFTNNFQLNSSDFSISIIFKYAKCTFLEFI